MATDIDDTSLAYAKKNVKLNNLEHKIEVRDAKRKPSGTEDSRTEGGDEGAAEAKTAKQKDDVLLGVVKEGESFAFCMCNPPFFKEIEQAGRNPKTVCTGTAGEMVTEGGEVGFVKRIIADSLFLTNRIRYVSPMVSGKTSRSPLYLDGIQRCWAAK